MNTIVSPDAAETEQKPLYDESRFIAQYISAALRHDQTEQLEFNSPYAACILPLLEALGWHNNARDLIEALPHFAEKLDIEAL